MPDFGDDVIWTVVADTGHVARVAAESSEAAEAEAASADPSFLPVAVFPGRVFEVGHPAAASTDGQVSVDREDVAAMLPCPDEPITDEERAVADRLRAALGGEQ